MTKKKSTKKIAAETPSNLSIKLKITKDKANLRNKVIITVQLLDGDEVVSSDTDFVIL